MSWRILSSSHRLQRLVTMARDKSSTTTPITINMTAQDWRQMSRYQRSPVMSDMLEYFQAWCSKPPKGFEKFFKDKPKTGGAMPDFPPPETPKSPPSSKEAKPKMPRAKPSKPRSQDLSELFKKFEMIARRLVCPSFLKL